MKVLMTYGLLALVLFSNLAIAGSNPFSEGNVAVKLTPDQIADLTQYINRSQQTLEQALDDAKGLGLQEASRVYLDAVKDVVIPSNSSHPRTELLMRVILNQALALTYGVPNANGNGLETDGVLSKASYQELLTAILSHSIELALQYVDQDRNAVQVGQLMDLPYAEVAYKRMLMSQDWIRSILEQELSARFGIQSLQQWLNLMAAQDEQHEAKYADEIDLVQKALKHEGEIASDPTLTGSVKAGEQERLARITMGRVVSKMSALQLPEEKAKAAEAQAAKDAEEADLKKKLANMTESERTSGLFACDTKLISTALISTAGEKIACHSGDVIWRFDYEHAANSIGILVYDDTKTRIKLAWVEALGKTLRDAQQICPPGFHVLSFGDKHMRGADDPANQKGEFGLLYADGAGSVALSLLEDYKNWQSSPGGTSDAFYFMGKDTDHPTDNDVLSGFCAEKY